MPWGGYNQMAHIRVPSPYWGADQADALMALRFGNAEQSKSTGGMVALWPRTDYAEQLHVPGGEPVQDLHVTLCFLGEDVSHLGDPGGVSRAIANIADSFSVINARIMGHATFNPDGGEDGEKDPCAVYLVSDSDELPEIHKEVLDVCQAQLNIPTQHAPWIPHLTAGYGLDANQLAYVGPVVFDRLGLSFAGTDHYYPLLGSSM